MFRICPRVEQHQSSNDQRTSQSSATISSRGASNLSSVWDLFIEREELGTGGGAKFVPELLGCHVTRGCSKSIPVLRVDGTVTKIIPFFNEEGLRRVDIADMSPK